VQDTIDFQTMLYMDGPLPLQRVRVFGNSDFSNKYRGRKTGLKGAFIVQETGLTDSNSDVPVVFNLPWKGWKLIIDGRERQFGSKIEADSGIHFFEISGTVPQDASGDLPLSVLQGDQNLKNKGQVVAIDRRFGARAFHSPGPDNWDKPYTYSHRLISPNQKKYDGMSMALPFSMKITAYMNVPADGEYELTGNNGNRTRIVVNGAEVFNNMRDIMVLKTRKIALLKSRPAKVEMYWLVETVPSGQRANTLNVQGPGMKAPMLAPYEWFYPVD
jgi:hypothetical protein